MQENRHCVQRLRLDQDLGVESAERLQVIASNGKIPSSGHNFLRDNGNKTELFNFLADKIAQFSTANTLIVTKEEDAVSNHEIRLNGIAPSTHEEADTRIFLHARHAVEESNEVLMIKSSDTDVLVIALSVLPALGKIGLKQLWIAFGQGQNLRWIPVHDLFRALGVEKSKAFS